MIVTQRLKFKSAKFDVDLELRHRKTVISGPSGTGKSFMVKCIMSKKKNAHINGNGELDYVIVVTPQYYDNIEQIRHCKGRLIIIDEVVFFAQTFDWLTEHIKWDNDNQYILIGRTVEMFRREPLAFAKVCISDDRTIRLNYDII